MVCLDEKKRPFLQGNPIAYTHPLSTFYLLHLGCSSYHTYIM